MVSLSRRNLLAALLRHLHASETSGLILLAVVVGLGAGLGAVVFRWLIAGCEVLFFGGAGRMLGFLGPYQVVPVPAAGGLLVGLLIYYLAREAKGHGVPEVMLAVAAGGGRIRPRVALVKSLASAICIGSGGSAGREGPIVQIGSALGSTLGQLLRMPEDRVRLLVACGAAGGISATFNAPIAGVLFALEVIQRQFAATSFGFVVFSSVTAAAISRAVLGNHPSFRVPPYELVSAWELPLYLILGLVAAGAALLFVKALYGCEDVFDRWPAREYVKPVLGGLLVGVLGAKLPQVFGTGYGPQPLGPSLGAVDLALVGGLTVGATGLLWLVKIVATSLTIGSGGSGGVFAPSLFIGSMLGATFGYVAHALWPGLTGGPGAYALVGMGAVFAGAARAPITSVIILFEMTGDYRIILPLMVAVVTSSLVSRHFSRDTIYTLKIRRRGLSLQDQPPVDLLDTVTVGEVMTREITTVPADMPVNDLVDLLLETGHHGLPVVDGDERLVGIVTLSDIQRSADVSDAGLAADIATPSPVTCFPDQTVREALQQLGGRGVGRVPVVDRLDPTRVIGILRRENVVSAYARLLQEHASVRQASERLRLSVPGLTTVEMEVPPGAAVIGRPLHELDLPPDSLLVAIRRAGRTIIPHGTTTLAARDVVTGLVSPAKARALRELLTAPAPDQAAGGGG